MKYYRGQKCDINKPDNENQEKYNITFMLLFTVYYITIIDNC